MIFSRVWENRKLTTKTKMALYHTCTASTLRYGSESCTTYAEHSKLKYIYETLKNKRLIKPLLVVRVGPGTNPKYEIGRAS